MSDKITKVRAQMKSRWYYFFWSSATVSVLLGQLYVGSGYRAYSSALLKIFESIELGVRQGPYINPYIMSHDN